MKYILIIFIFLFDLNPLFSQKDSSQKDTPQFYNKTLSKNNFCVELGGKAFLYSVGYERTLFRSKKLLLTGSIHLSYEPFVFYGIIAPIGITTLVGEKQNKLIMGFSSTSAFDFNFYPNTKKERLAYRVAGLNYRPLYILVFIQPSIGYRRYFKRGNSLSVAFVPILPILLDETGGGNFDLQKTVPWFGISYNFKMKK